jgi:alpha-galactosidase
MTVDAALDGDLDLALTALALDPLCAQLDWRQSEELACACWRANAGLSAAVPGRVIRRGATMKITIIGSRELIVFTRNLLTDFLTFPSLRDADDLLEEIEPDRLTVIAALAQRMVAQQGSAATIHTTTDLRAALDGADYVFSTVRVGDTRSNLEIPARYGVSMAVADTTGAGAAFYFLRNAPVIVNVARTMEQVCPDGLLLNYTNPMGMLCWAVSLESKTRMVGLCTRCRAPP